MASERGRGRRARSPARPEGDDGNLGMHGTCCQCGKEGPLLGVVMLHQKHPAPGKGWGCVACGLAPDGAIAVLCEKCADGFTGDASGLKEACAGTPDNPRRVPYSSLTGEHRHNRAFHPEMAPDDPG